MLQLSQCYCLRLPLCTFCLWAILLFCTGDQVQQEFSEDGMHWHVPALLASKSTFVWVLLFAMSALICLSQSFDTVLLYLLFAAGCFAWYSLFYLGSGLYQCSLYFCVCVQLVNLTVQQGPFLWNKYTPTTRKVLTFWPHRVKQKQADWPHKDITQEQPDR